MRHLLRCFFDWFFNQPSHNPNLEWYFLGDWSERCFGNLAFHFLAAVAYTFVALLPVIGFAVAGKFEGYPVPDIVRLSPFDWVQKHKVQFVIWMLVVTSSLPLFMWMEARNFENWVVNQNRLQVSGFNPDRQRKWFETNAKFVDSFWKTVGGLLLSAGILGLAKGAEKDSEPSAKIKALEKAASDLSAAAQSLEIAVVVIARSAKDIEELKALQRRSEPIGKESAPVVSAEVVVEPPDGTHT